MGRYWKLIFLLCLLSTVVRAQHTFRGTSLSDALIALDHSSAHYDISFVYDELEDFSVSKTISKGRSLPDAVREICGFYPVRVTVKGREIFVECLQKARTKLSGRLIDEKGEPVTYANLVLYGIADSVVIGGGVSNEAGDFVIPCQSERVRVKISCIGYNTIEQRMDVEPVGTISMQTADYYLGNVTVSGRLPVIRTSADRLEYMVVNDEFARGLTVEELLNRVPMVSTQQQQAIILGKGAARFLLNGREVDLDGGSFRERLWAMRADDIERIEVLTAPTGQLQMESAGGYINIVTRRDQALGWRSDLGLQGGMNDDWNGRANGLLSFASEKLDISLDVSGSRTTTATSDKTRYEFCEGMIGLFLVRSDTKTTTLDKGLRCNGMVRYMPVKSVELGTLLSYKRQWQDQEIAGTMSYGEEGTYSKTQLTPITPTTTQTFTAYCDWQPGDAGKKLTLTYQQLRKKDGNRQELMSNETSPSPLNTFSLENRADYSIQSLRAGAVLPFPWVTMEGGLSYTYIDNRANMEHLGGVSYDMDIYRYARLNYEEKTLASYLSASRQWNALTAKATLRYEHTRYDGEEVFYYSDVDRTSARYPGKDLWGNKGYSKLLPSLSLSYLLPGGRSLSLNWGKGIIRTNFYDQNPFRLYHTKYEYTEGNPLLGPSYTNDLRLTYQKGSSVLVTAYHHRCKDEVMGVTNVMSPKWMDESLSQNEVVISPDNFYIRTMPENNYSSNRTGIYLRLQYQLLPRLQTTAEYEGYYYEAYEPGTDTSVPVQYGWGGRYALSLDWFLNRSHTLQFNARYSHWLSDYAGPTDYDSYGYFHFALNYSLLSDRLRLSLVADDPFHQNVTTARTLRNEIVFHGVMEQFSRINHHSHLISLTATYSLGGKKVRRVYRDTRNTDSKRAEKLPANGKEVE